MDQQVSLNVRFLLWRKGVPRDQWEVWVMSHTSLNRRAASSIIRGDRADAEVSEVELKELAWVFDLEEEGEYLRFADLASDGVNVLVENLRFLFSSLEHGGKKALAIELGIDPTTVSRWLGGGYEPQGPSMRQLVSYFGLSPTTDLKKEPVFLSVDPVSLVERRRWLHKRIDALSAAEFRELYPALRRLLEER